MLKTASDVGGEECVTDCPMGQYNLAHNGGGGVKGTYVTELLAEAMGVKEQ